MGNILFLFAHGAGAPSAHPWMQRYKAALSALGAVETFDYPYMREKRRAPDRLPALLTAHREALAVARQKHRPKTTVLVGKSMGSRVGCHLALEENVDRLVCLGYPLKSMGKNATLRDAVLLELKTPVLFVQGSRDTLCPLDLLRSVMAKMTADHALHVVEAGNHSLEVTKAELKRSGLTQADVECRIMDRVKEFLGR